MQRLFNAAVWDEDGVRDDIRDYVIGHLGHPGGVHRRRRRDRQHED